MASEGRRGGGQRRSRSARHRPLPEHTEPGRPPGARRPTGISGIGGVGGCCGLVSLSYSATTSLAREMELTSGIGAADDQGKPARWVICSLS